MRLARAIAFAALVNLALFVCMERMVVARPTGWEGALETLSLAVVTAPEPPPPPDAERPEPERRDPQREPALDPPELSVPPLRVGDAPRLAEVAALEMAFESFGAPSLGNLTIAEPASLEPLEPEVHVKPRYPRRALSRGIEGRVVVGFTIAPDGTTSDLEIVEAEPAKVFDRAALDAVGQWRFAPQAAPRRQTVPIEFELAR